MHLIPLREDLLQTVDTQPWADTRLCVSLYLGNKKDYLPLLLVGDEQESCIDAYLPGAALYLLHRGAQVLALCAVTKPAAGVCEVCNLAVLPTLQRRGLGSLLLGAVAQYCGACCHTMTLGTGDSPITLSFYAKNGFAEVGREPGYFLRHYDHPIFEAGMQLKDRVLLARALQPVDKAAPAALS